MEGKKLEKLACGQISEIMIINFLTNHPRQFPLSPPQKKKK